MVSQLNCNQQQQDLTLTGGGACAQPTSHPSTSSIFRASEKDPTDMCLIVQLQIVDFFYSILVLIFCFFSCALLTPDMNVNVWGAGGTTGMRRGVGGK